MLLRSILELSSRHSVTRIPRKFKNTQIPNFVRNKFSTKTQLNGSSPPKSGGGGSGGSVSKVLLGSALLGTAALAAYQTGYLDQFLSDKKENKEVGVNVETQSPDSKDDRKFEAQYVLPASTEANELASSAVDEKVESNGIRVEEKPLVAHEEIDVPNEEKKDTDLEGVSQSITESDDQSSNLGSLLPEESPGLETIGKEENTDNTSSEETQTPPVVLNDETVEVNGVEVVEPHVHSAVEAKKEEENPLGKDVKVPTSLLAEYNLEDADGSSYTSSHKHDTLAEEEALSNALEDLGDAYISKDGKLVLDFLQVIHAAESRQAELDARMYAAEKKAMKEKYEKELKDAAIRELMLAEEAAMLDKELKRERAKAAAALRSLQEQLEEKYNNELENKKRMAENKLKMVEEMGKAELAARIAFEKAAQIEKIAEANLHIDALRMAFYARSEEARQSHAAHKLALGALALEDSLSKGLPIQAEIEALNSSLQGIDRDSVLGLVLSSLPEETISNGTDTILQLNQKFDGLEQTLRHFSLIPPGGGGILAHSVARIASWLKVKETDNLGDGIESLINRIKSHLVDGKIAEAAEALEEGVKGTEASEIVTDWVRRARNRAITEQALTLLQSYATSISVT